MVSALALMVSAQAAKPSSPATAPKYINILTGSTTGVFYRLGIGLSEIYRNALPQTIVSVQSTRGSAENLKLLQQGRAEAAFAFGGIVSHAWNGNQNLGFNVPHKKLRAIANLYPSFVQIITPVQTGIATLADLQGKHIAVNACNVGAEASVKEILRASGIAEKDVGRIECRSFPESVRLMRRGEIHALYRSAGLGLPQLRDLAAADTVRFIPIPAALAQKMGTAVYRPGVIPAKTYPGQMDDISTLTISNFLVTHEDMPAHAVYTMTRSMFENLGRLVKAHGSAKEITRANAAVGLPIPLHPGAEKYYRELGLLK